MPVTEGRAHTFSIIIVTYNSLPALESCLKSILTRNGVDELEVVISDNGSTDSSLATVRDYLPGARIIHNNANIGFGAACNKAAELATGEWLCFLNPDVRVDRDAFVNLISVMESAPQAGLVSARVRYADGRFQPTCRQLPTPANILMSRGSILSRVVGRKSQSNVYTLPDYPSTTQVPAAAATFAAIRRDLFLQVGGFDTRFFMYMEDTDLSLRLTHAGFHNYFAPSVGGIHLWWQGGKAGIWRRQWHQHLSVYRYFLKHIPNGFTIMLLPFLLAANYLVTCMASVVTGKTR